MVRYYGLVRRTTASMITRDASQDEGTSCEVIRLTGWGNPKGTIAGRKRGKLRSRLAVYVPQNLDDKDKAKLLQV